MDDIIQKPEGASTTNGTTKNSQDDPFHEVAQSIEDIDTRIELGNGADALTTTTKARAALSTTQTIDATTVTKIALDSETYDPGNNFDNITNYRFTIPKAGFYLIAAGIRVDALADAKTFELYVYKNGVLILREDNSASVASTLSVTLTDIMQLIAGDYIELYCRHNDGGGRNLLATDTYLAVHLLST